MNKFNFKNDKELVSFLLSVIRCGESLTESEELEIINFINTDFIKNLTVSNVPEMKMSN